MKAACFLGIALIIAGGSWGADEHPKLVLRVHDYAGVSASDLAGAVAETTRIFRAAGVDLIWADADPAAASPTIWSAVGATIVSSADPDFPAGVLGRALPLAVSGSRITLLLNNIRARATEAGLTLPILLGHALAHELGHVMLGAGAGDHQFPGLMCAQWGRREFDRIRHGALKFSSSQAVALRRSTHGAFRGDSSGMVDSGSMGELGHETWPRMFAR